MNSDASTAHPADLTRPPSARGRALILLAFVIVYAVACSLPAFHLTGLRDQWSGVEVMVIGPYGLRFGQVGWLANLTAVIALRCVMSGRTRIAIFCTLTSIVLGLQALTLSGRVIPLGAGEFNRVRVESPGIGYYVWMGALLVPLAAALLLRQPRPKARSVEL